MAWLPYHNAAIRAGQQNHSPEVSNRVFSWFEIRPVLDSSPFPEALMQAEVISLSAVKMAELVRQKKVSPVELAQAHLKRIKRLNPRLNAFVHVDEEMVLSQARAAEDAVMRGD